MSLPLVEPTGLADRIDRADERALAVSALACLDRCLPLLEYVDGVTVTADAADAALRPLWEAAEGGEEWLGRLRLAAAAVVRAADHADPGVEPAGPADAGAMDVGPVDAGPVEAGPVELLRRAAAVPRRYEAGELREWAVECSAVALSVHRHLDGGRDGGPLTTGERRRQERLLDLLAEDGDGLRAAFVQSTEGKRVLRAAAARRARRR
ncbi:hypothetical protein [Streptomyces sp. NPDC048442]|uniref:hypothetical protein n=1 Tax=Streptomyces sp. NPDC048442 TaxID=3154823 RepID=UPI003443485C